MTLLVVAAVTVATLDLVPVKKREGNETTLARMQMMGCVVLVVVYYYYVFDVVETRQVELPLRTRLRTY